MQHIDNTAHAKIIAELSRGYPCNDIEITLMTKYSKGIVVLFNCSYMGHGATKRTVEHRTSYFELLSIETDNDTLHKKLDFIC